MQQAALMTGIPSEADLPFEQIVRQREARILRIAFRILGSWADAEDVAQEVFVKLYRRKDGFANDAARNGWLCRVTVNLCLDRKRSLKPPEALPELLSHEGTAEASLLRDERRRALGKALDALPLRERAAIVLREIEGMSTAEVATALGSTEGTVRSQISKAMAQLRSILSKEDS